MSVIKENKIRLAAAVILSLVFFVLGVIHIRNHDYRADSESLEVDLYGTDDIPLSELAFPVIREVLKLYCGDLVTGRFPFRMVDIAQQV